MQKILDQKIGMGMVGDMGKFMQYQTAQSIPALAAGAGGGEGGGIVGSAVGLGAGVALGQVMANQLGQGLAAPAQGQVTYATDGTNAIIPGLTGFATTGADMTGLNVTATFSNGFSQSLAWGTTGVGAGGVFGTGWSLT